MLGSRWSCSRMARIQVCAGNSPILHIRQPTLLSWLVEYCQDQQLQTKRLA
jgi:hypothetical protein